MLPVFDKYRVAYGVDYFIQKFPRLHELRLCLFSLGDVTEYHLRRWFAPKRKRNRCYLNLNLGAVNSKKLLFD